MSKGFFLALIAVGGIGYFIYTNDPASGRSSGGSYSSSDGPIEVTPSNFESAVLENSRPVLVYFWASW